MARSNFVTLALESIQFLDINGEIIESDNEKAEALNNFFIEQSTLDDSNASLPEY